MKILLLQPPYGPNIIGAGTAYLTEPLALEVIAAAVPEQEVRILDMRIDPDYAGMLRTFGPDIVGITGCTTDVRRIIPLLRQVKEYDPRIFTVVGGHHATMVPSDFDLPFIDVVVIGEGEETFRELVAARERNTSLAAVKGIAFRGDDGKQRFTAPRGVSTQLDELPVPARHLTAQYRQRYFRGNWRPLASLMTSRGCPFRCNFCALWKATDGKYCTRSPESVVKELVGIREEFIDFAEDNVLHDVPRAYRLCEQIEQAGIRKKYKVYARADTVVRHPGLMEKWRGIGTELVLVGFESFRDDELRALNKRTTVRINEEAIRILQRNGMEIAAYFIVNPDYGREDFEALGEYVRNLGLRQPMFTVLTPLPGTGLYAEKKADLLTDDYDQFDFVHSVLPTRLPRQEFYACFLRLYEQFYRDGVLGSGKILHQVRSLLSDGIQMTGPGNEGVSMPINKQRSVTA